MSFAESLLSANNYEGNTDKISNLLNEYSCQDLKTGNKFQIFLKNRPAQNLVLHFHNSLTNPYPRNFQLAPAENPRTALKTKGVQGSKTPAILIILIPILMTDVHS